MFIFFNSPSNSDEDSPSDDTKALLADVRDQLLQGLADDAENIRYIIQITVITNIIKFYSYTVSHIMTLCVG